MQRRAGVGGHQQQQQQRGRGGREARQLLGCLWLQLRREAAGSLWHKALRLLLLQLLLLLLDATSGAYK
jgi:hypothetical protein